MTPEQQHPRSRRFGTSYPVSTSTEYDRGVDASSHRRRLDERRDIGIEWRRRVPLDAHAQWAPPENRTDPVETLIAQGKQRIPELLPERYARMRVDPFAFLRGAYGRRSRCGPEYRSASAGLRRLPPGEFWHLCDAGRHAGLRRQRFR